MIPPNPENPEEVGLRIHLADMLVTEFIPLFKDSTREPSKEALARGRRASVQALLKPCSARDSGTGCSTSISERECEIAKYRKHMMTAVRRQCAVLVVLRTVGGAGSKEG